MFVGTGATIDRKGENPCRSPIPFWYDFERTATIRGLDLEDPQLKNHRKSHTIRIVRRPLLKKITSPSEAIQDQELLTHNLEGNHVPLNEPGSLECSVK